MVAAGSLSMNGNRILQPLQSWLLGSVYSMQPAMEIELDAKLVFNLLKKEVQNPSSNDAFVADCREGLKEIPLICVQHCYREANKCADALARKCALLS